MWRDIGKACRWRHLRALSVRLFWRDRAMEPAQGFLSSTKVGCMVTLRLPRGRKRGRAVPP